MSARLPARIRALVLILAAALVPIVARPALALPDAFDVALLKDITPFDQPIDFTAFGDALYFTALDDDMAEERELWRTDGTPDGTFKLKDIYPGNFGYAQHPTVVGNHLLFAAIDPDHGYEIWRTDGTTAGTVLVKDINPGPGSGGPDYGATPADIRHAIAGGSWFFVGNDGVHGYELWRSDGTEAGTVMVKNIAPDGNIFARAPSMLTAVGDRVFFVADDGTHGPELWVTDGTELGTQMVIDSTPSDPARDGTPTGLAALGDRLIFAAGDGDRYRLYSTDGTEAGTIELPTPADASDAPENVTSVGGRVYFQLFSSTTGSEPWVTDGTVAGTTMLGDLVPGADSGGGNLFRALGGDVVFFQYHYDGVSSGSTLYRTDGTSSGTAIVADLGAGTSGGIVDEAVVWNDLLLFPVDDGVHDRELWVSDGTAGGTGMVEDIGPAGQMQGSGASALVVTAHGVQFMADDGVHGLEPWISDGTAEGTRLIHDIRPGGDGSGGFIYTEGTPPVITSVGVLGGLTVVPAYDNTGYRPYAITAASTPGDLPALSIQDASASEGGDVGSSMTFSLSLSQASGDPVSVSVATTAGSAGSDVDYTALSDTVTIPAGETSADVVVDVLPDALDESNETFTVGLTDPSGATIETGIATGTILDDDAPPSLTIRNASITEGHSGTRVLSMPVSLSAVSGRSVTVNFITANYTAVSTADYYGRSGTLTIPAGVRSTSIGITIRGDTIDEVDERFRVTLSGPVNATLGNTVAYGTIVDDDPAPAIRISDRAAREGNSGTKTFSFTITLNRRSSRSVAVSYRTYAGTATAGSDFKSRSGSVTFSPGQTSKTVSVTVYGDRRRERNETFTVRLSSPIRGTIADTTGIGTIRNDD